MTIPQKCERCGGALAWLRTEAIAEEYRCTACAHLLVRPPEGVDASHDTGSPTREVEVVWKNGHPSIREAGELRLLWPHLRELSPMELVRRFASSTRFALGRHHEKEALDLVRRGKELGLDIRCV